MRKDDTIRLRHMADAASEALGFAKTAHRRDLDSDRKLVLALVKDVEILGEAACRISPETRDTFPDLPWEARVLSGGYWRSQLLTRVCQRSGMARASGASTGSARRRTRACSSRPLAPLARLWSGAGR